MKYTQNFEILWEKKLIIRELAEFVMAEANRSSAVESGIPTGLNRIKTRRVASKERKSSRADDSDKFNESPNSSRHHVKQKDRTIAIGRAKINTTKEGLSFFAFAAHAHIDTWIHT